MVRKIPLKQLNAAWSPGSTPTLPTGIEFDCPSCTPSHRVSLGLNDQRRWYPALIYRYSGETIRELSLSPTFRLPCGFRGWIKLGHVEYLHLETRKVRRWDNQDFPKEDDDE